MTTTEEHFIEDRSSGMDVKLLKELWKDIGYLQGFYDGQLLEIRKQIAYEKMTPTEKYSHDVRDFFAFVFRTTTPPNTQ